MLGRPLSITRLGAGRGITEGDGIVRDNNTRSEPIAPSEFCIFVTFAGQVG